jgi:hypothetical protein
VTTGLQPLLGVDVWEVSDNKIKTGFTAAPLWRAHLVLSCFATCVGRYARLTFSSLRAAARVLPAIQEPAPRLRQGDLGHCQLEGAFVYFFQISVFQA